MIEKKMELLEEENDRLKKEIENLEKPVKFRNRQFQNYGMLMFS